MKIKFTGWKVVDGAQMKGQEVEWPAEKAQPYLDIGVAVEVVVTPDVGETPAFAPSTRSSRLQE